MSDEMRSDPLRQVSRNAVKSFLVRSGVIAGCILLGAVTFKMVEFKASLSFLEVGISSGSKVGNYYAVTDRLAALAMADKGVIHNFSSHGSVENMQRLADAQKERCDIHFALVQDGTDWQKEPGLSLIGRVGRPESVLFLGADADRIIHFSDLRGRRIGIGPEGSGTALLARQILESEFFQELDMTLVTMGIREQLDQLVQKKLALGVFVMQEDAMLLQKAIREDHLQLANFQSISAFSHRFPFLYTGSLVTGQYDPVKRLPPSSRTVLKLDTLLIGNSCASHSEIIALMTLLRTQFPDFIARNRQAQLRHAITMAPSANHFFDNNGGSIADTYVPWLVDFMPTSNWVYAVMVLSLFYNLVAFWNSVRLASIDTTRVVAERCIQDLFGRPMLKDEIARYSLPADRAFPKERLDELISFLEHHMARCRRQSLSILVPLGEEIGYRDQETLMEEMLGALKILQYRLDLADKTGTTGDA